MDLIMAIAVALVALVTYIGLTKKPPEPPIIEMPPLIRQYVELPPPEELEFEIGLTFDTHLQKTMYFA